MYLAMQFHRAVRKTPDKSTTVRPLRGKSLILDLKQ